MMRSNQPQLHLKSTLTILAAGVLLLPAALSSCAAIEDSDGANGATGGGTTLPGGGGTVGSGGDGTGSGGDSAGTGAGTGSGGFVGSGGGNVGSGGGGTVGNGSCPAMDGTVIKTFDETHLADSQSHWINNTLPFKGRLIGGTVSVNASNGVCGLGQNCGNARTLVGAGCDGAAAGIKSQGANWAEVVLNFSGDAGVCPIGEDLTGIRVHVLPVRGGVQAQSQWMGVAATVPQGAQWVVLDVPIANAPGLSTTGCIGPSLSFQSTSPSDGEFYIDNVTFY